MTSDKTLRKWYRIINRRFFDSLLPDNVCVRWATTTEEDEHGQIWEDNYFGEVTPGSSFVNCKQAFVIVLSAKLCDRWITRMSTLAHEMCHVGSNCRDNHGPAFERWRQYIADRGFFKKHALRRGRTCF